MLVVNYVARWQHPVIIYVTYYLDAPRLQFVYNLSHVIGPVEVPIEYQHINVHIMHVG